MNTVECEQGSGEWFQAKLGCLSSARIASAIAKYRDKKKRDDEMACRYDLRLELACERLTGKTAEHYVSTYMEQGTEREPIARAEYEMRNGVYVSQIGFVYHPRIEWAGCSPDGLVGDSGLIEIKCPKVETHLEYLLGDKIPDKYLPQMLWQLACTGREWNDFVSYHPDMPEDLQLFVKRLPLNDEAKATIVAMELEAEQFLKEVAEMVEKLDGPRLKRKVREDVNKSFADRLITEADIAEFLQ